MTTGTQEIHHNKLFWGSCLSLLTTAFAFSVITEIQVDIQGQFLLTNSQLGWFRGVFFGGFVISQVIFSPLCDTIGMRPIIRGAFIGHVAGALLMMFAQGYGMLVAGSLLAGTGAGLVEAGCNPLVVALYPKQKTHKLNIFHMWFPYGNVIAALLALGLSAMAVSWDMRLLLILVPAIIYGVIMWPAAYPETEGVAAGVGIGDMLKACFASPLMWLMLAMMFITASMELPGTGWVPPVLEAGSGVSGILIFAFIFGIMGTLRLVAGPVERRLRPTGILFGGAVLSTIGLYWFSYAETTFMLFFTAAIWAVGIAYFWPTMLGYVSENNPKSGALGLGLMGAVGMLASFIVTPIIGTTSDRLGHETIAQDQAIEVLQTAQASFSELSASGDAGAAIQDASRLAQEALAAYNAEGSLPEVTTTQALRAIERAATYPEAEAATAPLLDRVSTMVNQADNTGGRRAFRGLSLFGLILIVVFGALLLRDRARGGYQVEKLTTEGDA